MKIGPLFKWFGSKWQSAKHYPHPEHDDVCEPFAGGAGYSLNYVEKKVCIWDEDHHLMQLWPWLIGSATSQDILDIPVDVPEGTDIRTLGLSVGQSLLMKHWQRTNNVGECWTISPWGSMPGQWTTNTRARVADQFHRIRHWRFESPKADVTATWFIDPPYIWNYRYHRKLAPFDHLSLAKLVHAIPGKSLVIVCEAKDKKTGECPSYLPFVDHISSVTSRRKSTQSHHSSEVIYVRRPS